MKYLKGKALKEARVYFDIAVEVAKMSKCLRAKSGYIIVNDMVIGMGFNSPPGNRTIKRCLKPDLPLGFKSDKTCCVHAEDRAIRDALRNYPLKVPDSRLYYIRLDMKDNILYAGTPYCTWCSKTALDVGIAEFVLWHEKGICVYGTKEYNKLSFRI